MEQGIRAVVELGSTGIRLLVATVNEDGTPRVLESASRHTSLGRDVFHSGIIGRDSVRECVAVLRGFGELLRAYGIRPEDAIVVGTSAMREAENRDSVVDRIAMRTGFHVDIVEAIEENHYMFLAVQQALGEDAKLFSKTNSIIMEVGGGSTELMLLRKGKIVAAHSLRLGTLRLGGQLRLSAESPASVTRYISDNVRTICDTLDDDLSLGTVRTFIAIGSDARFAGLALGTQGTGDYRVIQKDAFLALVDRIGSMSPESVASEYRLQWSEAESIGPGLTIIGQFFERTGAQELTVPGVSIREGLLIAIAGGKARDLDDMMLGQVRASATNLGRRYRYHEAHAQAVTRSALFLFDQLTDLHGMRARERIILEVAATLHDVGSFIRNSGHHKHSEYIVQNSELFGLQRDEVAIIANVVRYHRKAGPQSSHVNYMSLPREDRVAVLKCSAILRIADALDRDHTQRVRLASVEVKEDHLLVVSEGQEDLSLERLSLNDKADMFEDVFGLKVVLI